MGSFMGRRWLGTWLEGKATAWEGCGFVSITQDISSSFQTSTTMLCVCACDLALLAYLCNNIYIYSK